MSNSSSVSSSLKRPPPTRRPSVEEVEYITISSSDEEDVSSNKGNTKVRACDTTVEKCNSSSGSESDVSTFEPEPTIAVQPLRNGETSKPELEKKDHNKGALRATPTASTSVNADSTIEDLHNNNCISDANKISETDEEEEDSDSNESVTESKAVIEMNRLIGLFQGKMETAEVQKCTEKCWKRFNELELSSCSTEFQEKIASKINATISHICLNDKIWGPLCQLLNYFKELAGGQKALDQKKKSTDRKIARLEENLKLISDKIEEFDQQDCNWDSDNENNSSYMVKDRLVNLYMKRFDALCKLTNSTTNTGRPIQRKIKISGIIPYNEIEEAVEDLVNSKKKLEIPDFPEVLDTAQRVSRGKLFLTDEDIHKNARIVFEHVINEIKRRRGVDLIQHFKALPVADPEKSESEDPANKDPELLRKLKENVSQRKTEKDVFREFVKLEEEERKRAREKRLAAGAQVNEEDADNEDDAEESSESEDEEDEEDSGDLPEIDLNSESDASDTEQQPSVRKSGEPNKRSAEPKSGPSKPKMPKH